MKLKSSILTIIIISQFLCTSVWFASNAVVENMSLFFGLNLNALGHLTSAIQLGFIIGTLIFAVFTISDRFSPSKVFFISAVLVALFNFGILWNNHNLTSLIVLRFFTGFFLAGIYPVGMKIAADYFEKGLGKSLGFLVGALVIGTAFPHLLNGISYSFSWKFIFIMTSLLSIVGGLMMLLLIPDGPFRKPSQRFDLTAFFKVFKNPSFRSSAFGYFGHMWELYAFWAFVPVILKTYLHLHPNINFSIALVSFFVIGSGGLSCVIGGYLSQIYGTKKIAFIALLLSCCCCLFSPILFSIDSPFVFISFLIFWGMVVIADSPLFSTLVAQNASLEVRGTALTIVNCIGFAITIISIQLISNLTYVTNSSSVYTILALGPVLGLLALKHKKKSYSL